MPRTPGAPNKKSRRSSDGNTGSSLSTSAAPRSSSHQVESEAASTEGNAEMMVAAQLSGIPSSAKNYEDVDVIGTGAYGTVWKARDLANEGRMVALKKVLIPWSDDGIPMNTLREIAILKKLENFEHPNIVRLLDICQGRRLEAERQLVLILVFEHVEQDLATYLEQCPSPGLGPDRIKDITFQLLSGVDFLHTNVIVHRDLKPQNVLITSSGQVKLADFGLARIYDFQTALTSVVVTLWYRSPEVILQRSYASAVDIWSCGCIFAELFRRKPLFQGQSEGDQLGKILDIIGTPPESEWPKDVPIPWTSFKYSTGVDICTVVPEICSDGKDLLQKMLTFDPNKRISAMQALSHAYFREYELYPPMQISQSNETPSTSAARKVTEGDTGKSQPNK